MEDDDVAGVGALICSFALGCIPRFNSATTNGEHVNCRLWKPQAPPPPRQYYLFLFSTSYQKAVVDNIISLRCARPCVAGFWPPSIQTSMLWNRKWLTALSRWWQSFGVPSPLLLGDCLSSSSVIFLSSSPLNIPARQGLVEHTFVLRL